MTNLTDFQKELFLAEVDKRSGFFVQDDVHLAHALSPLFASFQLPAMTNGTKKAFETGKLPILQFLMKFSDGRAYQSNPPYPGDPLERMEEHREWANQRFPIMKKVLFDYVDQEFLPFYRKLDEYRQHPMTLAEAEERVKELHQFYERAWELHFEIVLPRSSLCMALEELYGQLTEDQITTAVYELLTGVMNKTLETDRELWNLADQAKSSSILTSVLSDSPSGEWMAKLQASAEGKTFLERVGRFLEVYGYRTANSHEFLDETWVENPQYVLDIVAEYIQKDYDFEAEFARVVSGREEKLKKVMASIPEGEGKAIFTQLHQWALDSWGLDEDHHFFIDAMLPAKSRMFFLEVGKLLASEKVIEEPSDIFFLYYDELIQSLGEPQSRLELVSQRRLEHEQNRNKQVAPFYGQPPEEVPQDPMMERIFGTKAPEVNEAKQSFSGYGASQGIYTGVVTVVHGPEEFAKVKKGDILVCKTTTPPWTILFSIVGAVVTDAGGILSHAGTVAREYRLPAVVGTKVSTSILKDGDVVTVDGTDGVVYFGRS